MITKYIKANRRHFVMELQTLVRFASVSAQPSHKPDVDACASWLPWIPRGSISCSSVRTAADPSPIVPPCRLPSLI